MSLPALTIRSFRTWFDIMFADETIGLCSPDGQLFVLETGAITPYLQNLPRDAEGWFFNSSRDRYCAEPFDHLEDTIAVNPSFAYSCFGEIVITAPRN